MVNLFVYGILVGVYENRKPAKLDGYRKIREDLNYSIIKDESSSVEGELIGVSQKEFERIDEIEGYPFYYTRFVETISIDGKPKKVWVYQQTRHYNKRL